MIADKLVELTNKINANVEFAEFMKKQTKPVCLSSTCDQNFLFSKELFKLIIDLLNYLDEEMITNDGQCSSKYYKLKSLGYVLYITESDSFGPLGSCYAPKGCNWKIYYG